MSKANPALRERIEMRCDGCGGKHTISRWTERYGKSEQRLCPTCRGKKGGRKAREKGK